MNASMRLPAFVAAMAAAGICHAQRDVKVDLYDATRNCRDAQTSQHKVCVEPNERIVPGSWRYTVTTVNGNSRVVSMAPDPSNRSCLIVTTEVVPKGEQCVLGICNCQGNGWLGVAVQLRAER